ncbi:MAG: prepilin-type N-terminal cleavage/methylation domain-containing protein [Candidatus Calescibacterium sp.]|nr:prepilin-type N-terminal cleavage/methylation domain-containing protein [Candidatus Calescibacterium sp.]
MKNKGMTLVEVLFATAIFSFVAITLFALFKLGQVYWGRGMSYNMIQNDMKKTSTLLEKYLKQTDIAYVQVIQQISSIPRYAIFFPVQNEQGRFEYLGFISTIDRVAPDDSGFLYFVTFRTTDNSPTLSYNPTVQSGSINQITRNNINTLTIKGINLSPTASRSIVLLSNNIYVFEVRTNNLNRSVSIKMNFLKRTVGENTNQTIGASLFVITMNSFSSQ